MNSASSLLHLITPSRLAGAEILLGRLAGRQLSRGRSLLVACHHTSRAAGALRQSLPAGVPFATVAMRGKFHPRALLSLRRLHHRFPAGLVHSHLSTASWWAGWWEQCGGPPSLGHVHGFTSPLWHRRQRHLVAVSAAVRDHLVAGGINPQQITILPNAVDPEDIAPRRSRDEVRAALRVPGNDPVVICCAHHSEKKGWRELLAAVPAVLRAVPAATFWCTGDGPLRAELEASARQVAPPERVRFLGFQDDVASLMHAADVVALPSYREPFGLVYIEAALLEKPTVGCAAGGAPEVIADGETGLLVPPHDADALAAALITLLDDPRYAREMGRAGRERALELYNWGCYLASLDEIYERLADTP